MVAAADVQDEVREHLVAVLGVVHLRVVLEAIPPQRVRADGRVPVPGATFTELGVAQLLEEGPTSATESK